jgi:hypothetical protein
VTAAFMSKPKEMSKPVELLSPEELQRERHRCVTLIGVFGNKIAAKSLKKRLLAIDKRLAREARDS